MSRSVFGRGLVRGLRASQVPASAHHLSRNRAREAATVAVARQALEEDDSGPPPPPKASVFRRSDRQKQAWWSQVVSDAGSGAPGKSLAGRVNWFYPTIDNVPERTWELFNEYSGIPHEEIQGHWERMREKAFNIFPYPCIGQHRFLNLTLSTHFLYPEILQRLSDMKSSQSLIDIGCCMGQDLRKLVYDGAPAERLTGLDRDSRFIDLSFDLFGDRSRFGGNFVTSDMLSLTTPSAFEGQGVEQLEHGLNHTGLAPGSNPSYLVPPPPSDSISKGLADASQSTTSQVKLVDTASLYGKHDVVVANSFFHLYNLGEQLELAKRVARLMKPKPGSLLVGRQVGSTIPGEYNSISESETATRFAHDATTWRTLWNRVEEHIAKEEHARKKEGSLAQDVEFNGFDVEARLDVEELGKGRNQGQHWSEPNIRRMLFSVRRR